MTKINFLVGREHLDKNYETIMIPNNKKMEYEIIEEHKYTQYPSRENYTGIEVIVSVKEDYNDCKNIAAYIKAQYDKTIQKDKLSQFRIKLIIKLPASKLCTNKSYHLFYDQKNNNM